MRHSSIVTEQPGGSAPGFHVRDLTDGAALLASTANVVM
jgi:hypothetical protein